VGPISRGLVTAPHLTVNTLVNEILSDAFFLLIENQRRQNQKAAPNSGGGRESAFPTLIEELEPWTRVSHTRGNHSMQICEVVLVHDCGPDRSHKVIQELEKQYRWVRGIWLSRNYGQHAATLAGMASSIGDWVVTMDEHLQQNPADIGGLLDAAISGRCQLVYASPTNPPAYGFLRNSFSALSKTIGRWTFGPLQFISLSGRRDCP